MNYHACPIQVHEIDPHASHVTCRACGTGWRIDSYQLAANAEPIRHIIQWGGTRHSSFCFGCAIEGQLDLVAAHIGLAA